MGDIWAMLDAGVDIESITPNRMIRMHLDAYDDSGRIDINYTSVDTGEVAAPANRLPWETSEFYEEEGCPTNGVRSAPLPGCERAVRRPLQHR
jgi:hypothetical protein